MRSRTKKYRRDSSSDLNGVKKLSKSRTKEYRRSIAQPYYGLFKHGHRVTQHNRTNKAWVNCDGCLDYDTCKRVERVNGTCCEFKFIAPDNP